MRVKGLEPSRLAALDPKSSVYTNFTTPAGVFALRRHKSKRFFNYVQVLGEMDSCRARPQVQKKAANGGVFLTITWPKMSTQVLFQFKLYGKQELCPYRFAFLQAGLKTDVVGLHVPDNFSDSFS